MAVTALQMVTECFIQLQLPAQQHIMSLSSVAGFTHASREACPCQLAAIYSPERGDSRAHKALAPLGGSPLAGLLNSS